MTANRSPGTIAGPAGSAFHGFLGRGLTTAAFCCLVAAALSIAGGRRWDIALVYSEAIGLVTWLVIDLGRRALLRPDPQTYWPHGLRGVLLVVFAIGLGFLVGTMIGDAYCGCTTFEWSGGGRHDLAQALVITIAAGAAGSWFFYSRGKDRYLQARVALARRDAAEARLKLLEAQLEPHMLFNTLANLRALIAADPPRAQHMLDHLIAYLRATLGASRATMHPLADEFERLRDYLELMAVRMGPRLRFELDLPDALRAVPVPPLLLQPLVENSIRHGLEPAVAGGTVSVRAGTRGDGAQRVVLLEVDDSGVGARAAGPIEPGFGLAQVRERLGSVYGAGATLSISPRPGGGTRCTIALPRQP
ncbi:MAG: histidine kinase [Burkholderiales bacterium]|nr:histidine kinase [Burkholderiales bacterium]OJX06384.1 MAG: hypothetical protein BGO72_10700 [Burkholderiales bacterium 70-64]